MTPKEPDMIERCEKEAREINNIVDFFQKEHAITTALLKREKEIEKLRSPIKLSERLCKPYEDAIADLQEKLKIARDAISWGLGSGDEVTRNKCREALQKISEVGNKKSTAKDWLKWAGKIDLSKKSEDGHGE